MANTTHYASACASVVSRTLSCAQKSCANGMPHLGVAMHHPPGPRDIARAHEAGGRASPSENSGHQ